MDLQTEPNRQRPRSVGAWVRQALGSVSPRGWEVAAGLAAPVVLLGALLCGEGLLRYQQYLAFGTDEAEAESNDSVWEELANGRLRPRPNAVMGSIRFNALGFRGDELPVPKPAGLVRLGFFGSSTTMDMYVEKEAETWPAVATAIVKKAYPRCRIDYFNAGVMGYDVNASKERLFEDTTVAAPDITVFLFNDVSSRARNQLTARGVEAKPYEPSWFGEQSILWMKLEKNYTAENLMRVAARKDKSNRLDLDAMAVPLRHELNDLTRAVIARGQLPVLVGSAPRMRRSQSLSVQVDNAVSRVLYMPKVFIGDITESYYRYNDTLRQTAKDHDVPYIETIDRVPDERVYYVDSSHTTAAGSKLFGQIVGSALVADPKVRSVLHDRGLACD